MDFAPPGQQGFQLVPAPVQRRPLVDPLGQPLQQPHGDVAVLEGQPLEQKTAGVLHAQRVAAPVLEAKVDEAVKMRKILRKKDNSGHLKYCTISPKFMRFKQIKKKQNIILKA